MAGSSQALAGRRAVHVNLHGAAGKIVEMSYLRPGNMCTPKHATCAISTDGTGSLKVNGTLTFYQRVNLIEF